MIRKTSEILQTALLSLLIFAAFQICIQNFKVEGSSMETTLHSGQYLLVNKLVYYSFDMERLAEKIPFIESKPGEIKYLFHPPQRGEIVVFRYPLDTSRDFIKRVIAVPDDTVELREGIIHVNGVALDNIVDPHLLRPAGQRHLLGPDEYFVVGDNRTFSNDSRNWGPVARGDIIGRAWVAYWPFSELNVF